MIDIRMATFKKQNGRLAIQCPDCGGIPETRHMGSGYVLECLNCHQTLISYGTPEELSAECDKILEDFSKDLCARAS
jgi:ribosomal protein S27E